MANIVIAIPSFRRPHGLKRLLDAVERLSTDAQVQVLVADNDAERGEARAVCTRIGHGYRWPLRAILAPERGIAQARNALVAAALEGERSDFIAMLDDDEWPAARWLDALLRTQDVTGADALHGSVLRVFEGATNQSLRSCPGLGDMRAATGEVATLPGTANVLFRRDCFEWFGAPWFDPEFALTGGEDKEFLTRLARHGARFAWADEAVVYAHVPPSRASLAWGLRRAFRVGNSDMRVTLLHERGRIAEECAKIAAAFVAAPVQFAVQTRLPAARTRTLCRASRAAGKLAALFGVRANEYATVHGE